MVITSYKNSTEHVVYIIVHGTWSHHSGNWFMPGGDFFTTLQMQLPANAHIVPFLWSGKNSHSTRMWAGKALAQLIKSYPASTKINVIGHSHGASIVFIASQELAQTSTIIHHCYALATPVKVPLYMPNSTVIKKLYHLFSLQDSVQLVFGRFKRILPLQKSIVNIRTIINGIEPEHAQLHGCAVAKWIAKQHMQPDDIFFSTNSNGHILMHIDDNGNCTYTFDTHAKKLLSQECTIKDYMIHALKISKHKMYDFHCKNKKKLLNKINKYIRKSEA